MAAIGTSARIGWIGMGKMGLPICLRLYGAGYRVKVLPDYVLASAWVFE